MTFRLQENDINIENIGAVTDYGISKSRRVTFSINGKTFERDILLSEDSENESANAETFYLENRAAIEASLIDYLSENHLYLND